MVELKFHCCMPMFIARQWIRHRTANVNEYSGRYSLMPMLFYTPPAEQLQKQSRRNNQGRSGEAADAGEYQEALRRWSSVRDASRSAYEWMTGEDIARELARIDLPLSTYTQWYWKIDLHNLLHFLTLRVDRHAQWEIQEYGRIMAGMLQRVAPLSYEAWIDYDVCGAPFSRLELDVLRQLLTSDEQSLKGSQVSLDRDRLLASGLSGREVDELFKKLAPRPVPNFELDLSRAVSGEAFAERFARAVPKIDKAPEES
jgi:thymidylate synthase (FAD)